MPIGRPGRNTIRVAKSGPSSKTLRKKDTGRRRPPRNTRNTGRGGARAPEEPLDPMQEPYDPTVSQYRTNQDFEDAVGAKARSQIQPGLDDVNAQERAMQSASDRRMQELRGWYDWAYQGNSAAATQAQQALTQAAAAQAT